MTSPLTRPVTRPVTRPPRARPVVAVVAVLLALALVGPAVVGVHDLAAARGWSAGDPWVPTLVDRLDGLSATTPVTVASAVLAALGLLLLVAALAPARRTHLPVQGQADLWVSPAAVGALAGAAADRAPGVVSAEVVRSTRRRVVVEVVTQRDRAEVTADVRSALDGSVVSLTGTRVDVRATELPR